MGKPKVLTVVSSHKIGWYLVCHLCPSRSIFPDHMHYSLNLHTHTRSYHPRRTSLLRHRLAEQLPLTQYPLSCSKTTHTVWSSSTPSKRSGKRQRSWRVSWVEQRNLLLSSMLVASDVSLVTSGTYFQLTTASDVGYRRGSQFH